MTALTLVRRTLGVTVAHTFFAYPEAASKADIELVSQVAHAREGWRCARFSTLLIALDRDEAVLWDQMKSGCRQEVRRARDRDNLRVEIFDAPQPEVLAEFLAFFDASAQIKGIERADLAVLQRLAQGGALCLGRISPESGPSLAWHAHIVAEGRARLLHSAIRRDAGGAQAGAAAERGRANRLLHWSEICHFRTRGLRHYDFGGLALGARGGRLDGIDAFKQAFGGDVVHEFKCRRAVSGVGRLALGVAAAGVRAREGAARLRGIWATGAASRRAS